MTDNIPWKDLALLSGERVYEMVFYKGDDASPSTPAVMESMLKSRYLVIVPHNWKFPYQPLWYSRDVKGIFNIPI